MHSYENIYTTGLNCSKMTQTEIEMNRTVTNNQTVSPEVPLVIRWEKSFKLLQEGINIFLSKRSVPM